MRGDVAMLVFNALEAELVEVIKESSGLYSYSKTGDILLDKIGTEVTEKIDYVDVFDEDDALDTLIDLTPYLYHTITYYLNGDDEVAYVSDIETDEFTGTLVDDGLTIDVEDEDDEVETFNVTSQTALFFNGEEADETEVPELSDDGNTEVTVIYDEDDVVQGVIAWTYELTQIASSTPYNSARTPLELDREYGILPTMDDEDDDEVLDTDSLTIEGDVDSLEDIEQDDLVYIYASDEDSDYETPMVTKLLVVRDTFSGKYTRKVDDNTIVVGGEEFDYSVDEDGFTYTPSLGDDVILTLDKDGDIFDIDDDTVEEVDTDYALFIEFEDGDVEDISGVKSVDSAPTMRVLTSGGDVVVYDVYTDDLADKTDDFTTEGAVSVGAITLYYDGTSTTEGIEIMDAGIGYEDLIEFELNSDGEVDAVYTAPEDEDKDLYSGTAFDYDSDEMLLDDSFDVVDSTVVFDKTDMSWNNWSVESESILDSDFDGMYIVNDDYVVEVVVVTSGASVGTDEIYAIVTDTAEVYDADQDAAVTEYTMLIDGEEVVYLADEDSDPGTDWDADDELVMVTIDEDTGLVTDIDPEGSDADDDVADVYVGTDRVRLDSGTVYTLQDDADVYILETDDGDTVVSVGTLADVLEDDYVYLYETDGDDDGYIDTLILDLRTK